MKIILASSNEHKVKEINAIVSSFPLLGESAGVRSQCITESVIEFVLPPTGFDPIEDGNTFEENSLIKAKAAWELGKTWTLADDSGLCIDALKGAPGIHSARYAQTQKEKIEKLLAEMKDVPYDWRGAHFICSMVLVDADGNLVHAQEGRVHGFIDDSPKGTNGFGYDPIFFIPAKDKTMAELPEEEKNSISHRSNALRPMLKWIEETLL